MADGTTEHYPVDLVAAVQLEVSPAVEEVDGSVTAPVLGTFLFVQAYNYVRPAEKDHPFVPGTKYVWLTDEFHLLDHEVVVGPALLVPNLNPDGPGMKRWSTAAIGPKVARPHFYWLDKQL